MAKRFIYVPDEEKPGVSEVELEFDWFSGFSTAQKQRSIHSLHLAAAQKGYEPILEISSKSEDHVGVGASAFNLSFQTKKTKSQISVESAFQGSKVFEAGGPLFDLYEMSPRDARKAVRARARGSLTKFCFFGRDFPLRPRTFFYDWLYINTLVRNEDVASGLSSYAGFSDIEFNPEKSLNCQAFSAALYVSLLRNNALELAIKSDSEFLEVLAPFYERREEKFFKQGRLV